MRSREQVEAKLNKLGYELKEANLLLEQKKEWERVFETVAYYDNEVGEDGGGYRQWVDFDKDIGGIDLLFLFTEYLKVDVCASQKVRVSVREGAILIERTDKQ